MTLVLFTGMGIANAAPPVNLQDGLVNVGVGNVTIAKDVNVGVAAKIIAAVYGRMWTQRSWGRWARPAINRPSAIFPLGPSPSRRTLDQSRNSGNAPVTPVSNPTSPPAFPHVRR